MDCCSPVGLGAFRGKAETTPHHGMSAIGTKQTLLAYNCDSVRSATTSLYVGVTQRYARSVFPSQKMRCNKIEGRGLYSKEEKNMKQVSIAIAVAAVASVPFVQRRKPHRLRQFQQR